MTKLAVENDHGVSYHKQKYTRWTLIFFLTLFQLCFAYLLCTEREISITDYLSSSIGVMGKKPNKSLTSFINISMNDKNCLISECGAVGQAGTQERLLK